MPTRRIKPPPQEKITQAISPTQFVSDLPDPKVIPYIPWNRNRGMPGFTFESFNQMKKQQRETTHGQNLIVTHQFIKMKLDDGHVLFHPLRNIRHANRRLSLGSYGRIRNDSVNPHYGLRPATTSAFASRKMLLQRCSSAKTSVQTSTDDR